MNPTYSVIAPASGLRISHARVLSEHRSPRDAMAAHEAMRIKVA